MFPRIVIDKEKLLHNFIKIKEYAGEMEIFPVTKVYGADPEIAELALRAGFTVLADSRIENLQKLEHLPCKKLLVRLPMLSQVDDVVRYADISLNSGTEVLRKLNEAACRIKKIHEVMIMVELGDLREGVSEEQAMKLAKEVLRQKNLSLVGIATNLTCYGGVLPSAENLGKMVNLAKRMEDAFSIRLRYVNGGNSSSVSLLTRGQLPPGINNLRIGEAIARGTETAYLSKIDGMYDDCFILEAELIELEEKNSVPEGEIGFDAFGKKPVFTDFGRMRRGIVALGKQDTELEDLVPLDKHLRIMGGSSDHTILDMTDAEKAYRIGDIIRFNCSYGAILRAFTSRYVEKHHLPLPFEKVFDLFSS